MHCGAPPWAGNHGFDIIYHFIICLYTYYVRLSCVRRRNVGWLHGRRFKRRKCMAPQWLHVVGELEVGRGWWRCVRIASAVQMAA